MTIITKSLRDRYIKELNKRCDILLSVLNEAAELTSSREDLKEPQSWSYTDILCKIDTIRLRMAIGDFNVLLTELSIIEIRGD